MTRKEDLVKRLKSVTIFWVLLGVTMAYGESSATVVGRVVHQNQRPAANVTVEIGEKATATDQKGRYRIRGVTLGLHEVNVVKRGRVLITRKLNVDEEHETCNVRLPQHPICSRLPGGGIPLNSRSGQVARQRQTDFSDRAS